MTKKCMMNYKKEDVERRNIVDVCVTNKSASSGIRIGFLHDMFPLPL
jgi:hypothetical protein